MGRRVRVRHVDSGVHAVLKSDGVKAMLESQAAAAAARCNALCDPGLRRAGARYESKGVLRGYTAGGLVYEAGERNGRLAGLDNLHNNTLKKGCGV